MQLFIGRDGRSSGPETFSDLSERVRDGQVGRHLMALAVCFFASGCSSDRIMLNAAPDQDSIVRDGLPALISQKKHLVMLRPNARLVKGSNRPSFTLVVRNQGDRPETLLESNVTARQTIGGKITAVRVYRYEELMQEEQTRQAVAAFGAVLGAAGRSLSAANAGYVNTTGSYNSYGSYGTSYGTYSATTYDPARAQLAQQAANAQTQADFANISAQGEQNLAALQQTILKDNTVMVGEWIGGSVVLDPPQKTDQGTASYSIIVDFGGEQHTFDVSHVPT